MLSSEVVLITGAAGKIGSSTAIEIAKNKGKLILTDISNQQLILLKEKILKYTKKEDILIIKSDVTTTEGIENLIFESKKHFSKITSAIHCAYPRSTQWGKPFEEIKLDLLSQDFEIQLGSAIIFSQKIIDHFLKEGGGKLVHISSIQGIGAPKFEHYENTNMNSPIEYSAIKAGIISITK